jgi:hypothetical protein
MDLKRLTVDSWLCTNGKMSQLDLVVISFNSKLYVIAVPGRWCNSGGSVGYSILNNWIE